MTSPAAHPLELAVIAFDQAPDLGLAVRRLHGHCRGAEGPLRDAPITIVDNGSTDGTWLAAQALAAELDGVATRRTDERLGTKALRGLMADSGADTVAFVRVGPNSDLDTLLAPLSNTAGSATAVSTTASTTASGATTTPAATGGAVALAAEMTQGRTTST